MEFFDALVTLGLLDRDASGRYASPPDCARYLDRSSADYIGGVLEHLNSRMYYTWSKLESALRSGGIRMSPAQGGSYSLRWGGMRAFQITEAGFADSFYMSGHLQ